MTLIWRDPPGRVNAVLTPNILAELRAEPGRWALIREYSHHSRGRVNHPPDIEVKAAYTTRGRRRVTELYARAKPWGPR